MVMKELCVWVVSFEGNDNEVVFRYQYYIMMRWVDEVQMDVFRDVGGFFGLLEDGKVMFVQVDWMGIGIFIRRIVYGDGQLYLVGLVGVVFGVDFLEFVFEWFVVVQVEEYWVVEVDLEWIGVIDIF